MNKLEKRFKEYFQLIGKSYGLDGLHTTLLSCLYISPCELAMDQLVSRTGYSMASISTSLKMLEAGGFVKRTKRPGDRKAYFYMSKNLAILNIRKIRAARELLIKPSELYFDPLIKEFKNKKLDKTMQEQLKIAEDYYRQLQEFDRIMTKWVKDLEKLAQKRGNRWEKDAL